MKLSELLAAKEAEHKNADGAVEAIKARQAGIVKTVRDEGRNVLTGVERAEFDALEADKTAANARLVRAKTTLDEIRQAAVEEDTTEREQGETKETGTEGAGEKRAYDQVHRVTAEERQYAPHRERGFDQNAGKFRRNVKPGGDFEFDVAAAFLGDYEAQDRLRQHMKEERVERGAYLSRALNDPTQQRAVGTGAFAGLTVPQYLTDLYAPAASAKRPFADVCNTHEMPPQGMTVNISRITTATSTGIQASENTAVSETNIDDTLLTINVQTNAGQQTMSRQSIERGAGTEPVVMDDLFRRYASTLDSTLINQATNGLTNVASTITYTDASPTVAELAPLLSQGAAAVEAAMLDLASGENIALMNSRRWFWLNQAMSATWPLMSQPGVLAQTLGANYGETYGRGLRGILPNNLPVIVDANVPINLGGGTNQDEIYILDKQESHLWEDPAAPLFIRAEQPAAATLGVLLVLYGYFAYTHARVPNAQKISGTGLITPTWTGV